MAELRSKVYSICLMHGLTLQKNGINLITEFLSPIANDEHKHWLEKIIHQLQQQEIDNLIIDENAVSQALQTLQCLHEGSSSEKIFAVVDAFAIPKFKRDSENKKYFKCTDFRRLFGTADMKAEMYINRYNLIYQRLLRHELFKPSTAGDSVRGQRFKLQPVEYLLGSGSSETANIVIFGMLTQLTEGKYYLEDPTGTVVLDLSNAKYHVGLFTEGCFVIVEGVFEERTFVVKGLGLPPAETAEVSREFLGNINLFGGESAISAKLSTRLKTIEEQNSNASFVFIADVWLDDVKVMEKLRKLFEGFSTFPPTCFVLIGNFLSSNIRNVRSNLFEFMNSCFLKLADMILEYPSLVSSSKFIIVPGPQDPEFPEIVPRPPILFNISTEFCRRLPGTVFTTNPCRLQYCTQEIVVFREDLVTKMCRNCLQVPTGESIPTHFSKTLTSQASLSPLPIHILPVSWGFDHALLLHPLPDMVVCADKYHPFSEISSGCQIINPGSFSMSNYVFKVYIPSTRQVEDSNIRDE